MSWAAWSNARAHGNFAAALAVAVGAAPSLHVASERVRNRSRRPPRHGRRVSVIGARELKRWPSEDGRRLRIVNSRPATRGECVDGPRPCPYVGCRHNLYLDVTRAGGIRLNFPELEPGDMDPERSCSLDLADAGPQTNEDVARMLNVTHERHRQLLEAALARLAKRPELARLREACE